VQYHLNWPIRAGLTLVTIAAGGAFSAPVQAAGSTGVASVVTANQVRYRAGSGKTNQVVVTRSGTTVTIDDRVKIKAGRGCAAVKGDKTRVRCRIAQPAGRVIVDLYGGNDRAVNKSDLVMTADGGSGKDTLVGGPYRDVLKGGSGADKLWGAGGDDALHGGDGADHLYGGDGYEAIFGGAGDDVLEGGAGYDLLHGNSGGDRMYGGGGPDHLWGGTGKDRLDGGSDTDVLYGDVGADRLQGGAGNDELYGDLPREGAVAPDVLLGGPGSDSVGYPTYTKRVVVDLDGAARDDGQAGEGDTVGADVEHLTGGAGNDTLTGDSRGNIIDGGPGNDTIRGLDGPDTLYAYDGKDVVDGGAGDDEINSDEAATWAPNAVDQVTGGTNGALGDRCVPGPLDKVTGCERGAGV
jgi:serralysin